MRAGILRHRITFQHPAKVQDPASGEMVDGWIDAPGAIGVPAAIEPLSAREFIAAQASQSEVTARITIRYRPGISAAMRILHGDQIYNIHGVLPDPRSGREYLTLPVSTGVNEGQ